MKTPIKRILLVVVAVAILAVAIIGLPQLIYHLECEDVTPEEKRAGNICAYGDEELDRIVVINFLKMQNNGYRDYYYYDVHTGDGKTYIVELRDNILKQEDDGENLEFNNKMRYVSVFKRNEILEDMVNYRSTEAGQYADMVEDAISQ